MCQCYEKIFGTIYVSVILNRSLILGVKWRVEGLLAILFTGFNTGEISNERDQNYNVLLSVLP